MSLKYIVLALRLKPTPYLTSSTVSLLLSRGLSSSSGDQTSTNIKQSLSTAERYPALKLKRKLKYSWLASHDLDRFREILTQPGQIVTDDDQLVDYNVDWMKACTGQSKLALLPKSTQELSQILQYCNERNLAVTIRGGNTSLVGGSVPVFDEIAVSLRLMNKILSIDPVTGVAVAEAGVILDTLDKAVEEHGFTVPLDLASRHSCQIGGNVSTCAGGVRLVRYGSLRANVLGLEFVMADGKIMNCLSTMRKDNTGYDLKSLMIGAEGTLGVVTKVALLCPPRPCTVNVCLLALQSYSQVLELFRLSRRCLVEILTAYEYFDSNALDAVEKNLGLKNPLPPSRYYVLIETSGSKAEHDFEKLELLTKEVLKTGLCKENGIVLAEDVTKQRQLWRLREDIAVALQRDGYVYKFDVSLPQKEFPVLHEAVKERLGHLKKPSIRVASYGHVGDGNLHLNITSPDYDPDVMNAIDPFIFEFVSLKGGSISAEHGIGLRKRRHIVYSKKSEVIELMKALKRFYDPNGILNPYKTVDPDLETKIWA